VAADRYYPAGQATWLSTLAIDLPYTLSYVCWLVALVAVRALLTAHRPLPGSPGGVPLAPNTHVLLHTRADDTVIDASQNCNAVFPTDSVQGRMLAEVLGLAADHADDLVREVRRSAVLRERTVTVQTRFGPLPATISGVATSSGAIDYAGANLLLRLVVDEPGLDGLLTDQQTRMVAWLLRRTGALEIEEREIKAMLESYYGTALIAFHNCVLGEGGSILADGYVSALQAVARHNGWPIAIHSSLQIDANAASLVEAERAWPALVDAAREFVARTMDRATVDALEHEVRSSLGEATVRYVSVFGRQPIG